MVEQVPLPPGEGASREARARKGEASRKGAGEGNPEEIWIHSSPHPALRATLSRWERDLLDDYSLSVEFSNSP